MKISSLREIACLAGELGLPFLRLFNKRNYSGSLTLYGASHWALPFPYLKVETLCHSSFFFNQLWFQAYNGCSNIYWQNELETRLWLHKNNRFIKGVTWNPKSPGISLSLQVITWLAPGGRWPQKCFEWFPISAKHKTKQNQVIWASNIQKLGNWRQKSRFFFFCFSWNWQYWTHVPTGQQGEKGWGGDALNSV